VARLEHKRIWVAGHRGMVGSAIVRRLASVECDVLTVGREALDLLDQRSVRDWIGRERPDIVILAAARVGGILANDSRPADFLYENLAISSNVIEAAHRADVNRLLNLGSSCIYPKMAAQPIVEESLLTGPLEPTNEWYAVAKIAALKLTQALRRQYGRDYISAMPTNLYGPGDNYDLNTSHVLPALLRKAHDGKAADDNSLTLWGTGKPRREFLHVDDCADACVFLLENYSDELHINVGSGSDLSIFELAQLICDVVGFSGAIRTDASKPDGTPRKLMSNARIAAMGWTPRIPLREGIASVYQDFLAGGGRL